MIEMRSKKISCILLIIFLMSFFWFAYWSFQMTAKPSHSADFDNIYYVDEALSQKLSQHQNQINILSSINKTAIGDLYNMQIENENDDYESIDLIKDTSNIDFNKDSFKIEEFITHTSTHSQFDADDYNEDNYIEILDKDIRLINKQKDIIKRNENLEAIKKEFLKKNDNSNIKLSKIEDHFDVQYKKRKLDIPVYKIPRITKKNPFLKSTTILSNEVKLEENENVDSVLFQPDNNIIPLKNNRQSLVTLIHNGVASIIKINNYSNKAFDDTIPESSYILSSKSLPNQLNLRPFLGNGIIGTYVHSPNVYISGVYNGIRELSHRAGIPSTCSYNITNTQPTYHLTREYQMNLQTGIYSEITASNSFTITQSIYAHRLLTYLMVTQVEFEQTRPIKEDVKLNIDFINAWSSSYDISFIDKEYHEKEVSYKIGLLNAKERKDSKNIELHILYDHVPKQLHPRRKFTKTKWVFLTAYGFSKEEVELRYKKGVEDIISNDKLQSSHVDEWSKLWSCGRIDILGNKKLAQVVYSSWYHLLSSLPTKFDALFVGLSSDGLALGEADKDYQGRISMHQEIYMFPPILLFHRKGALSILESRRAQYEMAEKNAYIAKMPGLVYPFHSASTGFEAHPDILKGSKAPQVSAAILLTLRNYFYTTNHTFILSSYLPLISGIANFLQSRLNCGDFICGINDVSLHDWSDKLVSDSPMVIELIRLALNLLEDYRPFHKQLIDRHLIDFASKLRIRYLEKDKLHSAYNGYKKGESISELDSSLIGYPISADISIENRINNLEYYSSVLDGSTSPMSWSMQSIGFNEVGNFQNADVNFQKQLNYCKGDFKIWLNKTIHTSETCSHYLPAAGAFLQSIIHGYFGIRIVRDRLNLNPRLLNNVTAVHLVGLDYLGSVIDLRLLGSSLTIVVTSRRKSAPVLVLTVVEPEEIRTLNLLSEVKIAATFSYITSVKVQKI